MSNQRRHVLRRPYLAGNTDRATILEPFVRNQRRKDANNEYPWIGAHAPGDALGFRIVMNGPPANTEYVGTFTYIVGMTDPTVTELVEAIRDTTVWAPVLPVDVFWTVEERGGFIYIWNQSSVTDTTVSTFIYIEDDTAALGTDPFARDELWFPIICSSPEESWIDSVCTVTDFGKTPPTAADNPFGSTFYGETEDLGSMSINRTFDALSWDVDELNRRTLYQRLAYGMADDACAGATAASRMRFQINHADDIYNNVYCGFNDDSVIREIYILDEFGNQIVVDDQIVQAVLLTAGPNTALGATDPSAWVIADYHPVTNTEGQVSGVDYVKASGDIEAVLHRTAVRIASDVYAVSVQEFDTAEISGSDYDYPFNHDGAYQVEGLLDENTVALRAGDTWGDSSFPIGELNDGEWPGTPVSGSPTPFGQVVLRASGQFFFKPYVICWPPVPRDKPIHIVYQYRLPLFEYDADDELFRAISHFKYPGMSQFDTLTVKGPQARKTGEYFLHPHAWDERAVGAYLPDDYAAGAASVWRYEGDAQVTLEDLNRRNTVQGMLSGMGRTLSPTYPPDVAFSTNGFTEYWESTNSGYLGVPWGRPLTLVRSGGTADNVFVNVTDIRPGVVVPHGPFAGTVTEAGLITSSDALFTPEDVGRGIVIDSVPWIATAFDDMSYLWMTPLTIIQYIDREHALVGLPALPLSLDPYINNAITFDFRIVDMADYTSTDSGILLRLSHFEDREGRLSPIPATLDLIGAPLQQNSVMDWPGNPILVRNPVIDDAAADSLPMRGHIVKPFGLVVYGHPDTTCNLSELLGWADDQYTKARSYGSHGGGLLEIRGSSGSDGLYMIDSMGVADAAGDIAVGLRTLQGQIPSLVVGDECVLIPYQLTFGSGMWHQQLPLMATDTATPAVASVFSMYGVSQLLQDSYADPDPSSYTNFDSVLRINPKGAYMHGIVAQVNSVPNPAEPIETTDTSGSDSVALFGAAYTTGLAGIRGQYAGWNGAEEGDQAEYLAGHGGQFVSMFGDAQYLVYAVYTDVVIEPNGLVPPQRNRLRRSGGLLNIRARRGVAETNAPGREDLVVFLGVTDPLDHVDNIVGTYVVSWPNSTAALGSDFLDIELFAGRDFREDVAGIEYTVAILRKADATYGSWDVQRSTAVMGASYSARMPALTDHHTQDVSASPFGTPAGMFVTAKAEEALTHYDADLVLRYRIPYTDLDIFRRSHATVVINNRLDEFLAGSHDHRAGMDVMGRYWDRGQTGAGYHTYPLHSPQYQHFCDTWDRTPGVDLIGGNVRVRSGYMGFMKDPDISLVQKSGFYSDLPPAGDYQFDLGEREINAHEGGNLWMASKYEDYGVDATDDEMTPGIAVEEWPLDVAVSQITGRFEDSDFPVVWDDMGAGAIVYQEPFRVGYNSLLIPTASSIIADAAVGDTLEIKPSELSGAAKGYIQNSWVFGRYAITDIVDNGVLDPGNLSSSIFVWPAIIGEYSGIADYAYTLYLYKKRVSDWVLTRGLIDHLYTIFRDSGSDYNPESDYMTQLDAYKDKETWNFTVDDIGGYVEIWTAGARPSFHKIVDVVISEPTAFNSSYSTKVELDTDPASYWGQSVYPNFKVHKRRWRQVNAVHGDFEKEVKAENILIDKHAGLGGNIALSKDFGDPDSEGIFRLKNNASVLSPYDFTRNLVTSGVAWDDIHIRPQTTFADTVYTTPVDDLPEEAEERPHWYVPALLGGGINLKARIQAPHGARLGYAVLYFLISVDPTNLVLQTAHRVAASVSRDDYPIADPSDNANVAPQYTRKGSVKLWQWNVEVNNTHVWDVAFWTGTAWDSIEPVAPSLGGGGWLKQYGSGSGESMTDVDGIDCCLVQMILPLSGATVNNACSVYSLSVSMWIDDTAHLVEGPMRFYGGNVLWTYCSADQPFDAMEGTPYGADLGPDQSDNYFNIADFLYEGENWYQPKHVPMRPFPS